MARVSASTPGERARYELLVDPHRSNPRIAEAADCHLDTVKLARRQLEDAGEIPVIGAWDRNRRGVAAQNRPEWWNTNRPPMPQSMLAGLCTRPNVDPDWWTSESKAERQRAAAICHSCRAEADCLLWSMHLPTSEAKQAVYGGVLYTERIRLKRQREAQAAIS